MVDASLEKALSDAIWNLIEVHAQIEDANASLAKMLGISDPQWMVLMAIIELDKGQGVAGVDIVKKLRIHPAFVTSQTKALEQGGFISRSSMPNDARFVFMSLTQKARQEVENLSKKRLALNTTMFNNIDLSTLEFLNVSLSKLAKNARRAARLLDIEVT